MLKFIINNLDFGSRTPFFDFIFRKVILFRPEVLQNKFEEAEVHITETGNKLKTILESEA